MSNYSITCKVCRDGQSESESSVVESVTVRFTDDEIGFELAKAKAIGRLVEEFLCASIVEEQAKRERTAWAEQIRGGM